MKLQRVSPFRKGGFQGPTTAAAAIFVLDYAGVWPVADRIFNVEERWPRVGVLVVHERADHRRRAGHLYPSGLAKALTAHGFDARDVVLKRLGRARSPPAVDRPRRQQAQPAATTSRDTLDDQIQGQRRGILKVLKKLVEDWPTGEPRRPRRTAQQVRRQLRPQHLP